MDELLVLDAGMNAMRNANDVTLMTIPKLNELNLQFAFVNTTELSMENASLFESNNELMELKRQTEERRRMEEERKRQEEEQRRMEEEQRRQEEERKRQEEEERKRREEEERKREEELRERRENGIVLNADDLENLPAHVKSITVNACEDYRKEVLDLSRFSELETLKIGSTCFNYVSRVSVVGLAKLKSMTVGEGAFQNNSSDCALVVKNCPLLCEVRVGNESFKAFKKLELVELASLKTITLGCGCFREVDLVLKDLKSLEVVELGDLCFEKSRHTVIESLSLKKG